MAARNECENAGSNERTDLNDRSYRAEERVQRVGDLEILLGRVTQLDRHFQHMSRPGCKTQGNQEKADEEKILVLMMTSKRLVIQAPDRTCDTRAFGQALRNALPAW